MCSYGKVKAKLQLSDTFYPGNHSQQYSNTLHAIWELYPFVFRINENNVPGQTSLHILESVCKERGWKEFGEDDGNTPGGNILGWNLWWCSVVMMHTQTRSLYSWQYTNHIPKAIHFCNKEYLASFVRNMEDRYGTIFRFCPRTFTLPRELEALEREHEARTLMTSNEQTANSVKNIAQIPPKHKTTTRNCLHLNPSLANHEHNSGMDASGDKHTTEMSDKYPLKKTTFLTNKPVWICKPVGKSQGRGICLIDDLTNLPKHPVTVVQEYISKPLLISGYKFDLRLYVTIVSVTPLTIYAYREGLTRFATEPYDLDNLTNNFSHLTNSSLNKLSPGYEKDKEGVGHGCKWTLRRLRQYLNKNNSLESSTSDWLMWQKIMSIIVLTILGEVGQHGIPLPGTRNNFEFLGYDILIDSKLEPWLLEANLSPGLGGDCLVDELVKKPMLHDLFDLLGLPDGRPYVSLVPVSSLQKTDDSSVIAIDEGSSTAIKYTTEAQLQESGQQVTIKTKAADKDVNGNPSEKENVDEADKPKCKSFEQRETDLKLPETATDKKQEPSKLSKGKSNTKISEKLQQRLSDATAIYGKSLGTALAKRQLSNLNLKSKTRSVSTHFSEITSTGPGSTAETDTFYAQKFFASTDWLGTATSSILNSSNSTNSTPAKKSKSTIPHRAGVGLKRRSWYDSPERYGDWIRIFPFDSLSFQMTRGLYNSDVKVIINHLKAYLKKAQELFTKEPGNSDEFYNDRIREEIPWNSELWLPPKSTEKKKKQ